MQPDLADLGSRPRRYWNVDGLPELVMGLLWMTWGAAWLIGESLPRGSTRGVYWLVAPLALVGSGWAAAWLIKWLKARITFPRMGYVEWKEPSRRVHLLSAGAAVVVAAVLAGVAVRGGGAARNVPSTLGVILSLAFVFASFSQRAPHYLALAAVALALGLAFGSRPGGWTEANWLFVALGAATAVVGALRLAVFLRHNPRPWPDRT